MSYVANLVSTDIFDPREVNKQRMSQSDQSNTVTSVHLSAWLKDDLINTGN